MKIFKQFLTKISELKKWFQFLLIALIFVSIIISSVRTGYDSYTSFYNKKPNKTYQKIIKIIDEAVWYTIFKNYTGLDTGYGFFSPNVASSFVITHKLYSSGNTQTIISNSIFHTKEGALRFSNLNSIFMDKLMLLEQQGKQKTDIKQTKRTTREQYLSMILKRMSDYILEWQPNIDSIQTTVYLYDFPTLKEYPNIQPKLIQIENTTRYHKSH